MAKASLMFEQLPADIGNLISDRAQQCDEKRRPDPEVIAALAKADLMKLLVPREYGGHEVHPADLIEFTAQVAQIHGSTAWVAMTCNEEAELVSAYLPPDTCRQIWRDNPELVIAGSGVPRGRAVQAPVDGVSAVDGISLVAAQQQTSGC